MNEKRKIGIVTGSRAEFGAVKAVYRALRSTRQFDPLLYVTGLHLSSRFGNTIEDISKEKINVHKVIPMYKDAGTPDSNEMSFYINSISTAIQSFGEAFIADRPDLVMLTGDRIEMLAACIAAAVLKLPIAHIHGGDAARSGQIDEQIRHAITKFSHLHFPATELSKSRILQMGEEESRVFNVGSPSMDAVVEEPLLQKPEVLHSLGLDRVLKSNDDVVLCIFHPPIFNSSDSGRYMRELIECLTRLDKHVIAIYPNNDPGSDLIIKELENVRNKSKFHVFRNLDRKVYLSLMKYALFMIGNSSSGIIESAYFRLPVVNIGARNLDREASENVITVNQGLESIWEGIQKATSWEFREICNHVENKYGNGTAGEKIASILQQFGDFKDLLKKSFILR